MAKPTIMTALQVQILLLLFISLSAAGFMSFMFWEYMRFRQIAHIKTVISYNEEEALELREAKKLEYEKSLTYKLSSFMRLAGIRFSVYLFLVLYLLFVLFIGIVLSLFLKHWSGLVIGIPFGSLIFYLMIQMSILKRKQEFNRSLAISISVLVKMMKNGIGFEQAMFKSIAVSSSTMFKEIFENFFKEKNTIGEEAAFAKLDKEINSKELRIFALAVKIGRESGGQFSKTLEKVEETIRYRKKMQEKVDVVTREATFGSYVVAGIAIFLYFALDGNFDGKLHEYYMNSEYGRFQLLAIGFWVFLGLIANTWITKVEK